MVWSVTQLGLSEFCETLTGGFSSKTPMSGTLKGVELPGGWNSQGGGTPREVELQARWHSQGGGTPRGVELSGEWNSQQGKFELLGSSESRRFALSKIRCRSLPHEFTMKNMCRTAARFASL